MYALLQNCIAIISVLLLNWTLSCYEGCAEPNNAVVVVFPVLIGVSPLASPVSKSAITPALKKTA